VCEIEPSGAGATPKNRAAAQIRREGFNMAPKGKFVIVRTYSAGVHFGTLANKDGQEVTLTNARRAWYWDGAASLSEMAVAGVKRPSKCKFSVVVPEITLLQAIEIIPCSPAAQENLEGVPVWQA